MDLVTLILSCSLYPKNAIVDAMVQTGSKNNPLQVTVRIPEQKPLVKSFKSIYAASEFAQAEIDKGYNVELGLMKIPYRWLGNYKNRIALSELFRPCKNMVVATDILNRAGEYCASQGEYQNDKCILSFYKTGSTTKGERYAQRILRYVSTNEKLKSPLLLDEVSEESDQWQVAPNLPGDLGAVSTEDSTPDARLPKPTFDTDTNG